MVAEELKGHALSPEFPQQIRRLLELPRPLEIEGHPVREMWMRFRSRFQDFEVIDLEEVTTKAESLVRADWLETLTHGADTHRILRPEVTSQLINLWLARGGGLRQWVTVGRVFRKVEKPGPTVLEVHHQAEVFWTGERFDEAHCRSVMTDVATHLMPGHEFRIDQQPYRWGSVMSSWEGKCRWRDRWTSVASGGVLAEGFLRRGSLGPARHGGISFAFGLERAAQVSNDLDDIRALWAPPYVPS